MGGRLLYKREIVVSSWWVALPTPAKLWQLRKTPLVCIELKSLHSKVSKDVRFTWNISDVLGYIQLESELLPEKGSQHNTSFRLVFSRRFCGGSSRTPLEMMQPSVVSPNVSTAVGGKR